MTANRKLVWLYERDFDRIEKIQTALGLNGASNIIRYALANLLHSYRKRTKFPPSSLDNQSAAGRAFTCRLDPQQVKDVLAKQPESFSWAVRLAIQEVYLGLPGKGGQGRGKRK